MHVCEREGERAPQMMQSPENTAVCLLHLRLQQQQMLGEVVWILKTLVCALYFVSKARQLYTLHLRTWYVVLVLSPLWWSRHADRAAQSGGNVALLYHMI